MPCTIIPSLVQIAVASLALLSHINCASVDEERRQVAYVRMNGNCPGSFLVDVPLSTMEECKQHCAVLPQCVGFSHSETRDICFLKKKGCLDIVSNSEFNFYEKYDPSLGEPPKIISEASSIGGQQSILGQTSGSIATVNYNNENNNHGFIPRVDTLGHEIWSPNNNTFNRNRVPSESGTVIDFNIPNSLNPPYSMRQTLTATTIPAVDCAQNAGSNNEFILMFMFNLPDQPQIFDLEVYVSSDPSPGNVATEVQVTMPRYPVYKGDRAVLSPGQTLLFKLPQIVRMTQTGIESKAVRVMATNPNAKVSVYAMNRETYTADGFLVFSTSQLGLEHYVMSWQPSTRGSEFGLTVPYDGTIVQIIIPATPPPGTERAVINFNGRPYTNGDTIQLSLQANDAFLAINENLNSDLTGTRIVSNKPIAVFTGDKRTAIKYISGHPPTRDHLVEQLPPVHTWGTEFVFCTTPNRTDGDYMKIVSSQSTTQILVYGGVSGAQQTTIQTSGSFALIETAAQECLYISSTKPIMVGKFVVSQKPNQMIERTDPAAVIIPPTNTYRNAYTFMTPQYSGLTIGETFRHFILIGVKKEYAEGFIVDGLPAVLTQIVPTYNDYICGYLVVPSGQHNIQHSRSDSKYLAILYGAADRESYAFVLGATLQAVCDQSTGPTCQPGALFGNCPYCQEGKIAQGCYGTILTMSCPANRVVKVISAHYGWFPGICGGASCGHMSRSNCGLYNVYGNIARFCNGQSSCNFPVATNALFATPNIANYFCPLCSTRVQVHYTCIAATAVPCANLVGRTPLFVRYTASSFWRREPSRSDVTCPDDISMLTPIDAESMPAFLPEFARYAAPHGLMWCPSECDSNSSYIQIDLGRPVRVSGYAIQGRIGYQQWVSSVAIDYSNDGRVWQSVGGTTGQPSTPGISGNGVSFSGNSNAENVVVCDLSTFGISARYIRAWVRGYQGYPCMRFDVFTCGDIPQPNGTNGSSTLFPPTSFPIFPPVTSPVPTTPRATTPSGPDVSAVTTQKIGNGEAAASSSQVVPVGRRSGAVKGRTARTTRSMRLVVLMKRNSRRGSASRRHQPPIPLATKAPIQRSCPPLVIVNSNVTGAPDQRGVVGQKLVVHCIGDWMLPDFSTTFTAVCDEPGVWIGADYQCTELRNCGPIPDIDHARYQVIGDPMRVGSSVTYTCDSGYNIFGSDTVTCQTNTLWSAIPVCIKN